MPPTPSESRAGPVRCSFGVSGKGFDCEVRKATLQNLGAINRRLNARSDFSSLSRSGKQMPLTHLRVPATFMHPHPLCDARNSVTAAGTLP
jgi:hypothetical protein